MLRCIAFWGLFLVAFHLQSQNKDLVRKLKTELAEKEGTAKVAILNDLAWEYRASFPDSGIYYGQEAIALAKKYKLKEIAKSFNFVGLSFYHKGNYLDAYENYQQALTFARQNRDELQRAHANNNIGRLFLEQGLTAKGKDYLVEARDLFKEQRDSSGWAYALQSLASYYTFVKRVDSAEHNYQQAYRFRLALHQQRETVSALLQLGKFYLLTQKIDEALHCFQQADSAGRNIHDPLILAETSTEIAECLMSKNDLVTAEKMAEEGLNQIKQSQNVRLLPEAYLTLGEIQHKKGDLKKAKEYFNLTLNVSTSRSDLNQRMEAYFFLWSVDKLRHGYSGEFENYANYLALKDSVRAMETRAHESRLNFQMEIARRDAENEVLEAREQRKTAVIFVMAVIILSIAVILYLLVRTKNRVLRVNHLLEDRNGEIKRINHELEVKKATLEQHMHTLVDFSKNRSLAVGNLLHAAKDIVSITAKKLNVSQVSIWIYEAEHECIRAVACYNLHQDKFVDAGSISFKDAPAYFHAIRTERVIEAVDARSHAATCEFAPNYFQQFNIHSLLDVTFFLDGTLKGLLCCEQQGYQRKWTAEDKMFACSIADIISLAFRTAQRLEYEKNMKEQKRKIEQMNEVLEDKVKERTHELELQNKRLSEYAFINSHMLRGPLSRILGLLNLMDEDQHLKESELKELLRKSGNELDDVVKKITDALNDGKHLSIDDLR